MMFGNKKGVSPVIAVVLMIVVAVAISLVVYVWASGFVSEKTETETKAGDYSFLVETRDTNSTSIRNMGNDIEFTVEDDVNAFLTEFDIYVDDTLGGAGDITSITGDGTTWDKSEVLAINFNETAGTEIKLVHKDSGTPLVFNLE